MSLTKRLWLVRHGRNGEYERYATESNLLTVDFRLTGDLNGFNSRDALIDEIARLEPDIHRLPLGAGQGYFERGPGRRCNRASAND